MDAKATLGVWVSLLAGRVPEKLQLDVYSEISVDNLFVKFYTNSISFRSRLRVCDDPSSGVFLRIQNL
jgi:hypothetical protein